MESQNGSWWRRVVNAGRSTRLLRSSSGAKLQICECDALKGNLARDEKGETLVAFAVTLPILLSFLFGMMQVCLVFYTYEWISEAAREGTRYAMVHGSTCETSGGVSCTVTATTGGGTFPSVNGYVSAIGLPNLGGGTMNVATTYPDGDEVPPHRVVVNVTYTFPYKIPFVSTKPISLSSTSEMSLLQ
jgi:Flp pilus assembly protein TadG